MEDRLNFRILFLVLFLFLGSVVTQSVPRLSSSSEWRGLLELRSSLGIRAKDWPKKSSPCLNWTGIECRNGHVTGIKLSELRRTRKGMLTPRFAVDALQNFPLLSSFNSSGFSLPGSIPEWLGQNLSNLEVLDLRSCSIYGSIPSSMGRLSRLDSLYLSDNAIAGTIPDELGSLFSLSVLDLSKNLLTGQIPSEISRLGNLSYLDLSSNFLSGAIPVSFGSLSSLEFLNLSDNSLSGPIPVQIGNLSQLMNLDLGFNSLRGSLPQELSRLRSLKQMLIGNNELEGSLVESLFDEISHLEHLDISGNNFVNRIPDSLWSISGLKYLDVSRNNLTGYFPTSLNVKNGAVFNFSNNLFYGNFVIGVGVGVFRILDVSSNYFQGEFPINNSIGNVSFSNNCFLSLPDQRSSDDCRSFYSQRGLSFGNDDSKIPMEPPMIQYKSPKRLTYIIIGIFGGLGFILLVMSIVLLLLKICNFKQRDTNAVPSLERGIERNSKINIDFSILGDSFTYDQILVATGNFGDENLMKNGHSGDLFRGALEDGREVVVKRIALHAIETDSFLLELDLFNKVPHPRLVPLVGHCLQDEKEMILVYKYMMNKDLSNSLYRLANSETEEPQSLDWITRLKIATGAAEALSYLHHECSPPFVHRDIQASSILLDDKYEVRLGSLSEVCALETNNQHSMISRLLRQPQTSGKKPSGSSSFTSAHDVYCFGKVLLELVTGRIGISSLNEADTKQFLDSNLPFISIQEKELVIKIVDQSLIIDEDLLEEVWAVAIVAKSCLNPKAHRRPSMKHVLKALENPFKVVREETFSSERLRTASSTRSWTAAFFGSWRQNSSGSSNVSGQTSREIIGGLKQSERVGSRSSGANDYSSSHKRSSSDVFPEPVEMQDLERQDGAS